MSGLEMYENEVKPERALLVEVDTGDYDTEASLTELYELVRSAGAEPFGSMTQKRPSPDKATCVGSGMMIQIKEFCEQYEIELLVFDCELSPSQIRNIEKISEVHVVDRTMLILDIFAARAKSKEGKLQVELAQLRYMMPRLSGMGIELSRQGGGIGTRGPGESKLETDRRHIRKRIDNLNEQLDEVEKHRDQINRRRQKDGVITVALVGYTNAGKSTLMNYLTQAGVLVKDMLFATLDPTARALKLPHGTTVMVIDTVGFVRRLPHHLVQAFRSTLEQAATADIILNICDASSPEAQVHLEVTKTLLAELGCEDRPIIPVFNKCDMLPPISFVPFVDSAVRISATTGDGVEKLLSVIEENLPVKSKHVKLILPFAQSGLAAQIRRDGIVESEEYIQTGLMLTAQVSPQMFETIKEFIIEE